MTQKIGGKAKLVKIHKRWIFQNYWNKTNTVNFDQGNEEKHMLVMIKCYVITIIGQS